MRDDTLHDKRLPWLTKCDGTGRVIPLWPGPFPSPETVYLELTAACDNRCPGCSNSSFIADFTNRQLTPIFRRPPLTVSQWARVLDRFTSGLNAIYLTGGEATLYPNFDKIVNIINQRAIPFVVFTNGRWRNRADRLITLLAPADYCRGLLISLHGASADTHDKFTGIEGSFHDTVETIARTVGAGLHVAISAVITRHNVHQLEAIADLAYELQAAELTFNRYLIPASRKHQLSSLGELGQTAPDASELRQAIEVIERLRQRANHPLRIGYGPCIPQCFAASSSRGCTAGEEFVVVDPWGNVKPCTDTTLICGNLLEQSLEEVWGGPKMAAWRNLTSAGCTACSVLSQCRTGCRAIALASGLGRDPLMTGPILSSSCESGRDVA